MRIRGKRSFYRKIGDKYIKGLIQNTYHDYRHILDIKTILNFGNKLQKKWRNHGGNGCTVLDKNSEKNKSKIDS